MKLLLDENVSPALVQSLAVHGHAARAVAHVGLTGLRDDVVFAAALEADETVVTVNAEDFLVLAAGVEVHAGVIVLREADLTRAEQLERILAALAAVEGRTELINTVVEVRSALDIRVIELPRG